jgi:hypothetical protein
MSSRDFAQKLQLTIEQAGFQTESMDIKQAQILVWLLVYGGSCEAVVTNEYVNAKIVAAQTRAKIDGGEEPCPVMHALIRKYFKEIPGGMDENKSKELPPKWVFDIAIDFGIKPKSLLAWQPEKLKKYEELYELPKPVKKVKEKVERVEQVEPIIDTSTFVFTKWSEFLTCIFAMKTNVVYMMPDNFHFKGAYFRQQDNGRFTFVLQYNPEISNNSGYFYPTEEDTITTSSWASLNTAKKRLAAHCKFLF